MKKEKNSSAYFFNHSFPNLCRSKSQLCVKTLQLIWGILHLSSLLLTGDEKDNIILSLYISMSLTHVTALQRMGDHCCCIICTIQIRCNKVILLLWLLYFFLPAFFKINSFLCCLILSQETLLQKRFIRAASIYLLSLVKIYAAGAYN